MLLFIKIIVYSTILWDQGTLHFYWNLLLLDVGSHFSLCLYQAFSEITLYALYSIFKSPDLDPFFFNKKYNSYLEDDKQKERILLLFS